MKEIILGTVQFGLPYGINNPFGKPGDESVFEILNSAYDSGVRTLDTADGYGEATKLIGRFHRASGKFFSINTKFTIQPNCSVPEMLETALLQLDVQSVDTYFYHSFTEYLSACPVMESLLQLKAAARIKHIGLSVYDNSEFENAIDDDHVDVIQIPFNMLDNYTRRGELMRRAKENGKTLQVRSVFLQGLFFKPVGELPPQLLPLKQPLERLQKIAADHSLSMEHLALQYAMGQDEIDAVLIGVDSVSQLQRNLDSLRRPISQTVRDEIDAVIVTEPALLFPYNWNT